MIEQLKTIREALALGIKAINHLGGAREAMPLHDAMPALAQVEAMAEQEPVAWAVYWGLPPTRKNSVHFDMESAQAVAKQIKSATEVRPLYAAPVAQQPQAEKELRKILCVTYAGAYAYMDDGEAQDSRANPTIDFMRDTPAEIQQKMQQRSLAQQPQARPDFTDEWAGYLKDGETPFERFLRERKDVQSVLKLYQRALEENERLKAQQPQAEAVPDVRNTLTRFLADKGVYLSKESIDEFMRKAGPQQAEAVQACGHPMSLLLRSAESNESLYCEACDDKSGRHDAERRETELLDANRRLQEKIASADALKLHAIEELCQLGYTVKDGELIPPDHLHKLVEAAGHPLAAPQQAEAVPHLFDPKHMLAVFDKARHGSTGPAGFARGIAAVIAEWEAGREQAEAVQPDVVRDAERYRWLRNENNDKGTKGIHIAQNLYGIEWDAAIDAAIAQQKGQP